MKSAPTEFGAFSYRIDVLPDGRMRASITPPSRRSPAEIRLRLRDSRSRTIASVETSPAVKVQFTDETVILPDLQIPVDLTVHFKDGQ